MRQDSYKKIKFKKWLIPRIIGTGIILITVLLIVIITTMQQNEQLYLEGAAKSIPLLKNEKMQKLGDLYIKLNNNFEQEIKNYELNYANRLNKRGDKIYYGVNGRENIDAMINDDYVNGIASVKYIKGSASDRPDGDSNFVDMIAFMTESLGVDVDRYSDDELSVLFTDLFKLTHTFSGTSTELYPCDHGCAWCKYYCGDIRVQGEVGGEIVGYYKCDEYMGKSGQYGLMYDPFIVKKESNYQELKDLLNDEAKMKTTYQYKDVNITFSYSEDGVSENHTIVTKGDTVVSESDEIFLLNEPEGFCSVCTGMRQTFTSTTRKFGGCITHVECHHGDVLYIPGEEGDNGTYIDWYMDRDKGNCDNAEAVHVCTHICGDSCDGESGCVHEGRCLPEDIGCAGYYVCDEGHEHYACPGHIIVCCFGHTNLNLEVKIMYYEEMINTLK